MKTLLTFALLVFATLTDATNSSLCPSVAKCIDRLDNGKKCKLLPVPTRSLLPAIAPGTFKLSELRPGVWSYEDGAYNCLILRVGLRLAVLDFPDSSNSNIQTGTGTLLTSAVDRVLGGAVPHRIDMVYSHAHFDHIGAATRFYNYARDKFPKARIMVWGTDETRRLIRETVSKKAVEPNIIVPARGRTLSLGSGLIVKMMLYGGHTQQDLVLHIPPSNGEQGVVFYVDVVFPRWAPFPNLGLTENVRRYLEVQKKIVKLEFGTFLGGHVNIGTKRDVLTSIKFTKDLLDAGKTALEMVTNEDFENAGIGKVSDPSAAEFGNFWFAIVNVVRRLQVDACFRIVIEKWGCKLGGLDIVLRSHCFVSVTHNLLAA